MATTKISISIDPEQDAKVKGVDARKARLGGEVVWCAQVNGQMVAFVMQPQALAIGLCMYRWCTKKAVNCKRHAAVRGKGGC